MITESKQEKLVGKKQLRSKYRCLTQVRLPLGTRSLLQSGTEHRLWLSDALCVEVNAECTFFKNRGLI